jgi:hypothetical protein
MSGDIVFCFEDDMTGCVCGWCGMTEEEIRASLGEEPDDVG